MDQVTLAPATLEALRAHARQIYPDECCGLVLRREGVEEIRRIRNIQDELHAGDPDRYPRTARTAYYMDGRELLAVLTEVDRDGWEVAAFYHSHPDHAAYFSQEDTDRALFDGQPLHPDTAYLVLALTKDEVRDMRAFRWDAGRQEFAEAPVVTAETSRVGSGGAPQGTAR
jgi:[CysO sulfur-carrier protein]-S-L-cysteine hydrolase